MKFFFTGILLFLCMTIYSQKTFTLYFDFNKYNLTETSRAGLDSFLRAEKENLSGSLVNLDGYCDADGTDSYNDLLSMNRVKAVKKYLLKNGIRPGDIGSTKGHGEKDPLNENKTEEERQLNRRVEISMIISLEQKIADTATKAGTKIVLRNINFVGGRHESLPESQAILEELWDVMRANPKLIIEIQGHICCQPGEDDGVDLGTGINNLSEARAKAIRDYLLLRGGINPDHILYKGFGHSAPIYPFPEQSEMEKIQNRRVEIKIISK